MSWAAVIAGGVALAGAAVNANASSKAAGAQKKSADAAIDLEREQLAQSRADLAPWRTRGSQAIDVLGQQMGLGTQPLLSYEDWLKTNPNVSGFSPAAAAAPGQKTDTIKALTRDLPRRTAEIGDIFGLDIFGSKKKKKKAAAAAAVQTATNLDSAQRSGYDAYVQDFNATHAKNPGVDGDLMRDFTIADFEKDPGYEFRRAEGQKGVEASAAARGILASGGTLKGLDRYNQDYASGEFSNAYNRFNNDRTTRFNRLSALAGLGQTSTNTGVAAGANTANSIADLTTQRGNAEAAGAIARGNAINDGVQSLSDFYQQQQYNRRRGYYPMPRSVDSTIPG
jgi:hypothetical protein